ncbi:MAG: DedA family protein [Gaiellaceae bacterium]
MRPVPLVIAAACVIAAAVLFRRGRRRIAAAAVAAAAAFAVYSSGVIELPSLETILEELASRLGRWTYVLVGGLAFAETAAFVGLVAPGELAVVFGGVVAGHGEIDPVWLVVVVWACAALGDSTGYVLGRRLGRGWAFRHGPRIKVTRSRFESVERFFNRHGGKTIVVGRFIGFVRALAPFVAGASRVPYTRFLGASLLGAGLWSAAFVALGYVFWRSLDQALEIAKRGNLGLLAFVALAGLVFGAYRLLHGRTSRARLRLRVLRLLGRRRRRRPPR